MFIVCVLMKWEFGERVWLRIWERGFSLYSWSGSALEPIDQTDSIVISVWFDLVSLLFQFGLVDKNKLFGCSIFYFSPIQSRTNRCNPITNYIDQLIWMCSTIVPLLQYVNCDWLPNTIKIICILSIYFQTVESQTL